jgi:purine-binding chemotaxis protein CheW
MVNTPPTSVLRGTGTPSREMQFVSFALAQWEYAVNVEDVYGIYHGLPLIPNPDMPSNLDGEVQLSDRRIPVLNLRRFSGLPDPAGASQARWILMVNDGNGPIGLIVDKVNEVVKLTAQNVKLNPEGDAGPVKAYITAMADVSGHALFMPDLGRLLHDATH